MDLADIYRSIKFNPNITLKTIDKNKINFSVLSWRKKEEDKR